MNRIVTLFVVALLIMVLAISGCKRRTKLRITPGRNKERGEFVLGLDDSFPPMGFRMKGEIVGFDIDLAKEVCARLGIKLRLQPINWSAKEQELNTKNIDCIWNGLTITPERREVILFTKPYMRNRQVLVVRLMPGIASSPILPGRNWDPGRIQRQ